MITSHLKLLMPALKNAILWTRQKPSAALLIIFLFHALTNAVVLSLDKAPLMMDEAVYFDSSGHMLKALIHRDTGFFSTLQGPFPPLHRIVSLPFYLVFGYLPDVAVLSTLVASAVLITSLYHIGKELQDSTVGLLSAAVAVLLPGLFGFSRTYLIEYTLTAAITLSLALMLKTDYFSSRRYTFAFGMSVAIGLLIKWNYTPFVIWPFLLYLYHSYRNIRHASKKPIDECLRRGWWLLFSVLSGLVLASLWYVPNAGAIAHHMGEALAYREKFSILSSEYVLYYLRALPNHIGWLFLPLSIASLAYLLARRHKGALLVSLWIFIPYIFFTFMVQVKTERYVHGYLPAFAILIAIMCMNLHPRFASTAVSIVLLVGLLQMLALSFLGDPRPITDKDEMGLLRWDQRDWQRDEVAAMLNGYLTNKQGLGAVVTNDVIYSSSILSSLQHRNILVPFTIYQVYSPRYAYEMVWDEYRHPLGFYEQLFTTADIVLLDEALFMDSRAVVVEDRVWLAWNSTRPLFSAVRSITLPDGFSSVLYVKKELVRSSPLITSSGEVIGHGYWGDTTGGKEENVAMEMGVSVALGWMQKEFWGP